METTGCVKALGLIVSSVLIAAAWLVPTFLLSVLDPPPAAQWWHGGIVGTLVIVAAVRWSVGRLV